MTSNANGSSATALEPRIAYEMPTWKDRVQSNPKLASALVKAQAKAKSILRDTKNPTFERKYTSSDSMIGEAKDLFNEEGLAVLPISFESLPESALVECDAKTTFILRPVTIRRWFKLMHTSGEFEIIGPYDWPTNPNKGTPTNLAFAATDTLSLAYVYRDLLGLPRLTLQEIQAMEREEEKALLEANMQKAPVPSPTPKTTMPQQPVGLAQAPIKQPEAAKLPEAAKAPEKTVEAKPTVTEVPKQVVETQKTEVTKIMLAPAVTPVTPTVLETAKQIGDEMVALIDDGAAKHQAADFTKPVATAPVGLTAVSTPAVAASVPITSENTIPTVTATAQADDKLKARQASMLSRLQKYGAKRTPEIGGDLSRLGDEINAFAGNVVMSEGRFKRSGLTDESMKKLEITLAKCGV